MATNYVLVDFENVQPDLSMLANTPFRVKVFVGAKQQEGRVSFKLLDSMQKLGANVEPSRSMRSGRNAVDMHIAYYIGRLHREGAGRGDPHHLERHRLRSAGRIPQGQRRRTASAPSPSPRSPKQAHAKPQRAATARHVEDRRRRRRRKPHSDKLAPIIKHLHSLSGKPATRKKLAQTIANYFRHHGGALADTADRAASSTS